jgi:hypothetical protein
MNSKRRWLLAAATIACASASTTAFAQSAPSGSSDPDATSSEAAKETKKKAHDKAAKSKEKAEKAKKASTKATEEAAEDAHAAGGSAEASTTTVTSSPMTTTSPEPGAERPAIMVNKPLLIAGAAVLAASYIPSATVGIVGRDDDRAMIAPIVGPWIALGQKDCNEEPCNNEGLDKTLMVVSGVAQGAGAIAMAMSLFIPPGRNEIPGIAKAGPVTFTPLSYRSGAGVGALGVF